MKGKKKYAVFVSTPVLLGCYAHLFQNYLGHFLQQNNRDSNTALTQMKEQKLYIGKGRILQKRGQILRRAFPSFWVCISSS